MQTCQIVVRERISESLLIYFSVWAPESHYVLQLFNRSTECTSHRLAFKNIFSCESNLCELISFILQLFLKSMFFSSVRCSLVLSVELIFWCILHINIMCIDMRWTWTQVLSYVIRISVVCIVGIFTRCFVVVVSCVFVTALGLLVMGCSLVLPVMRIYSACIPCTRSNSAILTLNILLLLHTDLCLFLLPFHHFLFDKRLINLLQFFVT